MLLFSTSCTSSRINNKINDPDWVKNSLRLRKPNFSIYSVEIRVWEYNFSTGNNQISVFVKNKDGSWIGKRKTFYYYNEKNTDFEVGDWHQINIDDRVRDFLSELSWDSFSTIPSQDFIDRNLMKCTDQILIVADGKGYVFDFLARSHKRRIFINNPEDYFVFYAGFPCAEDYQRLKDVFELWKRIPNE